MKKQPEVKRIKGAKETKTTTSKQERARVCVYIVHRYNCVGIIFSFLLRIGMKLVIV